MSNAVSEDNDGAYSLDQLFVEEARPPSPDPTVTTYIREQGLRERDEGWNEIQIRLVGSHSLWGHHLWNAARALATYLDQNKELYYKKAVLELGAGGGLPGILTAKNGAREVVLTDYPDTALIDNLNYNIEQNTSPGSSRIRAQGYLWGQPVKSLLEPLEDSRGYDLVILSDLVFNHSQHAALLKSCEDLLSPGFVTRPDGLSSTPLMSPCPCVLVFYTHHRPHLAHQDMVFFSKAEERGWTCEKILTRQFPPMFPDDPGEELVRATVHGWRLIRLIAQ